VFSLWSAATPVFGQLAFTPSSWDFGPVRSDQIQRSEVAIHNPGSAAVSLTLNPSCDCLTGEPAVMAIPAGGTRSVSLRYDPKDDNGPITKRFILVTEPANQSKPYFIVTGSVTPAAASPTGQTGPTPAPTVSGQARALEIDYYYEPGCAKCLAFLSTELPAVAAKLGLAVTVREKHISDADVMSGLMTLLSARGAALKAFPVLVCGAAILQGDAEIKERLESALAGTAAAITPPPGAADWSQNLAFLPVLAAGLVDGINPCAFSTIIFLVAALAYVGRARREILVIGGCFTLAVFLTYFLLGLGFFYTLRATTIVPVIAVILKWVLFAVLIVFSGISVYDYALIRQGRTKEILLKLPKRIQERIHNSVRAYTRSAALIASSLVLGVLVSLFEVACTGQIYFPVIGYLVQTTHDAAAYLLLAVYNLGFIAPLVAVFALSYAGVSSTAITQVFQRHLGKTKLLLAGIFVLFAVLTVVL
jgi:cytochrome c biogenesis protein CcdA